MKKNDFRLFLVDSEIRTAHQECINQCGSINFIQFARLREGCEFWKQWSFCQFLVTDGLDGDHWEILRAAVRKLQRKLEGMTLPLSSESVARLVCGMGVPTNPELVDGLVSRLKWWQK